MRHAAVVRTGPAMMLRGTDTAVAANRRWMRVFPFARRRVNPVAGGIHVMSIVASVGRSLAGLRG